MNVFRYVISRLILSITLIQTQATEFMYIFTKRHKKGKHYFLSDLAERGHLLTLPYNKQNSCQKTLTQMNPATDRWLSTER